MILLGLLGWPVSHSLSPKLQNAALQAAALEGKYELYPVDPNHVEKLHEMVEKVRSGELTGLNVTIPYKQTVIPYLDKLTPSAEKIGAVNHIYLFEGQLVGNNTDSPGFQTDLRNKAGFDGFQLGNKALILGSGGSARAVVTALLEMGWDVCMAARNWEQAKILSNQLGGQRYGGNIECISLKLDDLAPLIGKLQLVVNTTPVGMHPIIEFTPWPEGLAYPAGAFVYDLIYNPSRTLFVRHAEEAGLHACNGLGMLVEQAALGFEIWTGKTASRKAMYSAVSNFGQI